MTIERYYLNYWSAPSGSPYRVPLWPVSPPVVDAGAIPRFYPLLKEMRDPAVSSNLRGNVTSSSAHVDPLHIRWSVELTEAGSYEGGHFKAALNQRRTASGLGDGDLSYLYLRAYVRHTVSNTETLVFEHTDADRLPTKYWQVVRREGPLSAVSFSPGDYLSFEVGFLYSGNVYAYTAAGSDTSVAIPDETLDGDTDTTRNPWIEFHWIDAAAPSTSNPLKVYHEGLWTPVVPKVYLDNEWTAVSPKMYRDGEWQ